MAVVEGDVFEVLTEREATDVDGTVEMVAVWKIKRKSK